MRDPSVKVFVSHSMDETGKKLLNDIRPYLPDNVKLWVADERPTPGRPVTEKIRSAIEECDAFLALLTDQAAMSQWVNQEIGIAHEKDKMIIPIRVKGVHVSGVLTGREWIEVDPSKPEKAWKALSFTLNNLVNEKRGLLEREENKKWGMILIGALALLGAAILAFLFSRKER